jgi:hypothetical protein
MGPNRPVGGGLRQAGHACIVRWLVGFLAIRGSRFEGSLPVIP